MTKSIIPQNTQIEPVRLGVAYGCPIGGCRHILYDNQEAMRVHVRQKVWELPTGLVYRDSNISKFLSVIQSCQYIDLEHVRWYNNFNGGESGHNILSGKIGGVSAKDVIVGLSKGVYSLVGLDDFCKFKDTYKSFLVDTYPHLELVRTTPELEEMIARMKVEKK